MNFIICEDEDIFIKNYKKIIDNFMMNYDIEYKIHIFKGYDEKFKKTAKELTGFKVYILDIKTNEGSGLSAARIIREEIEDWTSMLIMITSYCEYHYELIGKRLMVLDFINKLDEPERRLKEDLKICLKSYDSKPITLKYKYKGINYNIALKDIIYVEKEQDSKRCIIHTNEKNYYINGTLNEILKLLDERFIKTHRSLIINKDQISYYKSKTNQLFFKNNESTYLISRSFKKEMFKNARVVN